jgi:Excalibur calcium-binding domain
MSNADTRQIHTTVRRGAERRRRHRRIAAVITLAVLAALVLGVGATRNLSDSAAPPSPATPGPHPTRGLLTLAANPLLVEQEGNLVRPAAAPVPLSACLSSPLTWGAAESGAATYGRPGQPRFGNEFVLRFNSVAAAHGAVTDAWRQFHDCPTPPTVVTDPWDPPLPGSGWHLSEYFANQRARFATPRDTRLLRNSVQPVAMYSLRVARRQNVVVVVETTDSDDRAGFVLSWAMSKATADMQRERALLSAVGATKATEHTRHTKPAKGLYANCDEDEAAEAAPLHGGTPGYGPERDGLGDGVACVS